MGWKLVGTKESTFDWWSVAHFGFFVFLASSLEALTHWFRNGSWWWHLCWFVPVAIGWEVFERFAEKKWPAAWSNKVEHWSNAWIGDMLSDGAGFALGIWMVSQ